MPKRYIEKKINRSLKGTNNQQKSRIKTKLRSVLSNPIVNVITLVLLFLVVFAGLRFLQGSQSPGQVKFIERSHTTLNEKSTNGNHSYSPEIFAGEVYETSIRLREAGALGMAISLAVFTTGAEQGRVPANLEKIWSEIHDKKLMPPGLEMKNGELRSPSAKIIVRYQAQPLRFEILSLPLPNAPSPALLISFPLNRLDGRTITYFQSSSAKVQDVPPPFASLEKIVSAGWTLEQWRGELTPKIENQEQVLQTEKNYLE